MSRIKPILRRLLYPAAAVKFLFTPLAAVMLVYSLRCLDADHPFSYISYCFSAYVLSVLVLGAPSVFRRCKATLLRNPYTGAYLLDAELRVVVSLYIGFGVNLLYVGVTLYSCISLHSFWFGAIALYYIVLCSIRFIMLKNIRHNHQQADTASLAAQQLRQYRFSGYLLLIVTLVMTGVIFQMICHDQSYHYPGFMIYASALYVFYHLSQTMVSAIRFHRSENLLFSSIKIYDLTAALMAMLALQSAMFSRFGGNEFVKQYMLQATGIGVYAVILYMAIHIIRHANRRIRDASVNIS